MIKPILVDSGFLVALLDRSEKRHQHCIKVFDDITRPLISCEAVVAEVCYLVRNIHGASHTFIQNIIEGIIELPWSFQNNAFIVNNIMKKYADLPTDFADACLVAMAEKFNTNEILTLDSDFQVYRWAGRKRFIIYPD